MQLVPKLWITYTIKFILNTNTSRKNLNISLSNIVTDLKNLVLLLIVYNILDNNISSSGHSREFYSRNIYKLPNVMSQ